MFSWKIVLPFALLLPAAAGAALFVMNSEGSTSPSGAKPKAAQVAEPARDADRPPKRLVARPAPPVITSNSTVVIDAANANPTIRKQDLTDVVFDVRTKGSLTLFSGTCKRCSFVGNGNSFNVIADGQGLSDIQVSDFARFAASLSQSVVNRMTVRKAPGSLMLNRVGVHNSTWSNSDRISVSSDEVTWSNVTLRESTTFSGSSTYNGPPYRFTASVDGTSNFNVFGLKPTIAPLK